MTTIDDLTQTGFCTRATQTATQVMASLAKNHRSVAVEFVREPDEHEFYVLGVGQAIVDVIYCSQQLEHAVELLGDFSYSAKLRARNIQRRHHLEYNIENYLIRTQILYERILQLVNRVFHLLNPPGNCRDVTVLKNIKVARTKIPGVIGSIRKKIRHYADQRNLIVHHESHKEDDLRRLGMLSLVPSLPDEPNRFASWVKADQQRLCRRILAEKRAEFTSFNESVVCAMLPLFDVLGEVYDDERARLTRIVGPLRQESSA